MQTILRFRANSISQPGGANSMTSNARCEQFSLFVKLLPIICCKSGWLLTVRRDLVVLTSHVKGNLLRKLISSKVWWLSVFLLQVVLRQGATKATDGQFFSHLKDSSRTFYPSPEDGATKLLKVRYTLADNRASSLATQRCPYPDALQRLILILRCKTT